MAKKDEHDQESAAAADQSRELRRQKRRRCLLYIFLFAVFQTGIILLFALTVMKIRTPKFRVISATFTAFDYSTDSNPSFNITMIAELSVKNTNFGHYKFQDTIVSFYYNNAAVGSEFVPGQRVRARSTRKIFVVVELSSAGLPNRDQLGSDLSSGVLALNSRSTLSGKVELLKVLKRKKSAEMDCYIAINLRQRIVGYLSCV